MEHTRFVGLDIHKERISIAVAESGLLARWNISVRFPTIPLRSVSCATVSSVRARLFRFATRLARAAMVFTVNSSASAIAGCSGAVIDSDQARRSGEDQSS